MVSISGAEEHITRKLFAAPFGHGPVVRAGGGRRGREVSSRATSRGVHRRVHGRHVSSRATIRSVHGRHVSSRDTAGAGGILLKFDSLSEGAKKADAESLHCFRGCSW